VEPLAYSVPISGVPIVADRIRVHNVYTGVEGTPIDLPSNTEVEALGVSSDGQLLFALDYRTNKVYVMNALTGTMITTYQSFSGSGVPHGFLSTRPNGFPTIWLPGGDVWDTETHQRLPLNLNGNTSMLIANMPPMRAATPDGKRIIGGDPSFSRLIAVADQRITVLGGKALEITNVHSTPNLPVSNAPWDLALAGDRIFVNDGFNAGQAYQFAADNTLTALADFPVAAGNFIGIQAIESTWDGRVFYQTTWAANPVPDTTDNVYIYDQLGNSLGSTRFGSNKGFGRRATFGISGDLFRMVCVEGIPNGTNAPVQYVVTFDDVP